MARAVKTTAIGRGPALPDSLTGGYDQFIVETSADPTGEPDGFYYTYLGTWVRDGGGNSTAGTAIGTTLPDASSTAVEVFVVQSSAAPATEPDGLYYRYLGSWVRVQ